MEGLLWQLQTSEMGAHAGAVMTGVAQALSDHSLPYPVLGSLVLGHLSSPFQ